MKHLNLYRLCNIKYSKKKKPSYYVKRLFFIVLHDNDQIFSLIMTME